MLKKRCPAITFPRPRPVAALAIAAVLLAAPHGQAVDWPSFRGPNGDGTTTAADWSLPQGDADEGIRWRTNVGIGAASVAVQGERLLTLGNRNDRDVVSCLDTRTGNELWTFEYTCPLAKRQFEGGPAATPTIDGERVYVFSHDGQLYCLQLEDGSRIWEKHVVNDFGGSPPTWKYAGSPALLGDLLLLDIGGRGASTIALNKHTGAKVWGAGSETGGYAPVVPFEALGVTGLLVFKAKHLIALDQQTRKELWRLPWETAYDVNASTPLVLGDRLFVSSGYPAGRGALYRFSAAGPPEQLWLNSDIKTKTNSCAVSGNSLYAITDAGGKLICVDLESGRTLWGERGFGYGTFIIAGDRILALTERGDLVVVQDSQDGYKELARRKVLNGRCWVHPVLANGHIYCRSNAGDLVCIDVAAN